MIRKPTSLMVLGVDTNKLKPSKKIIKPSKILLPARILYEKGVEDYVNTKKS